MFILKYDKNTNLPICYRAAHYSKAGQTPTCEENVNLLKIIT